MTPTRAIWVAGVTLGLSAASIAMATPGTDLDLSVPEAPAFVVLDLAAENVMRPATPRELAASLLNGVDRSGNLQTGAALAFAPYQLTAMGRSLTLADYRGSPFLQQPLFRTELSLATTKGATNDDESIRVSTGLRSVLWAPDEGRQDRKLDECLEKRVFAKWVFLQPETWPPDIQDALANRYNNGDVNGLDAILETKPHDEIEADLLSAGFSEEQIEEFINSLPAAPSYPQAAADACFAEARERAWNARGFEIGGAFSMISPDGDVGDLASNGGAVWTSFSYGFQGLARDDAVDASKAMANALARNLHFIAHLRYRNSAVIVDDDGSTFDQDDLLIGGRLRIRPIPRFRDFALSAELAYIHAMPDDRDNDDSLRYSGTAEVKIASNLWLQATAGANEGNDEGDSAFVIGGIKFGFNSESVTDVRAGLPPQPEPEEP